MIRATVLIQDTEDTTGASVEILQFVFDGSHEREPQAALEIVMDNAKIFADSWQHLTP